MNPLRQSRIAPEVGGATDNGSAEQFDAFWREWPIASRVSRTQLSFRDPKDLWGHERTGRAVFTAEMYQVVPRKELLAMSKPHSGKVDLVGYQPCLFAIML